MKTVTLTFKEKSHSVAGDNVWGLIEAIEDHVTMSWLAPRLQESQVPLVKVFKAYAAALKFAGSGDISLDDIRDGVTFQRGLEMAIELAAILSLAYPSSTENLPKSNTKSVEELKKNPSLE
jgi:hypothetical protein